MQDAMHHHAMTRNMQVSHVEWKLHGRPSQVQGRLSKLALTATVRSGTSSGEQAHQGNTVQLA